MSRHTEQQEAQRIGQALQQAEKTQNVDAQIRLYKKLLRLTPNVPIVHAQLAHLYFEQAQEGEATIHVLAALEQAPEQKVDEMIFPHLYEKSRFIGNVERAMQWYDRFPTLFRFKLVFQALSAANEPDRLESLLHTALERFTQPGEQSQVLALLGQAYYTQARFHDTIACYQLGLQMTPGHPTQLLNLAVALEQVGRYPEALTYYKQLLAITPDHSAVHNNIAINLLRLGEFDAGWSHYEWRWKTSQAEHYQQFSIPRWTGEPLQEKTLLVWAEQGIGDHIMFASLLHELKELAGELHYEIYARLDTLFQRSFPGVKFIRGEQQGGQELGGKKVFQQSWPRSDYQIPIGSLPGVLRPTRESFPEQDAYLIADTEQTQLMRDDYRRLFPGKRLVGISWRGGKTFNTEKQSRFIPFSELSILTDHKDVQLIDLQYDSTPEELEAAAELGVHIYHDDRIDARGNLDDQASQISALDAVVSVDNTSVHLAGALGVPTYALLPMNPNWRWGFQEGQSYWYRSVQLFRNSSILGWHEPLQRVVATLKSDGRL